MTLDPATADPKALAEALKRECEPERVRQHCLHWTASDCHFAAALLGVVEECDKPLDGKNEPAYETGIEDAKWACLRAAAARFVAAGGRLDQPGPVAERGR